MYVFLYQDSQLWQTNSVQNLPVTEADTNAFNDLQVLFLGAALKSVSVLARYYNHNTLYYCKGILIHLRCRLKDCSFLSLQILRFKRQFIVVTCAFSYCDKLMQSKTTRNKGWYRCFQWSESLISMKRAGLKWVYISSLCYNTGLLTRWDSYELPVAFWNKINIQMKWYCTSDAMYT